MEDNYFSLGKTYDVLEKEYTEARNNLLPHSYHFLIHFAEVATKEGRMRRAIELTREALIYAPSENDKAYVYLSLARLYRMLIEMRNTRAELVRGFKALGESFPKGGILRMLCSSHSLLIPLSFKKRSKNIIISDELTRKKILASLYEEAALSIYYMRGPQVSLMYVSFTVRKIASQIGPSLEMMNYLAATATMFAIYKDRWLSRRYLRLAKKVVYVVDDPAVLAKYRTWEMLSCSYLDQAVASSNIIEALLAEHKKDLTPYNLLLVSTTLCTNYVLRGKTTLALSSIDQMMTPYDRTCTKVFSCNKTFTEWYKIPSLAFRGEFEEADRIIVNSRAIFASVDEEKWQIGLFLGNMLIYYYLSPSRDYNGIRAIFDRFNALKMVPKKTFIEGQHFWIARSYLLIELYQQGEAEIGQLISSIKDVKENSSFRETRCHYFVLEAQLQILRGSYRRAKRYLVKAKKLATEVDSDWVLFEVEKLSMVLFFKEKKREVGLGVYASMSITAKERGWNGYMHHVDKIVSNHSHL